MIRLSEEEFSELVDQAVASLPKQFKQYMENISVDIQPRPTRDQGASLDLPRNTLLLGLYHGVPLTEKTVSAPWEWPERIYIFQRNIEAVCRTRKEVLQQVRTTVLHEVGHHFGLSDDDLHRLGME